MFISFETHMRFENAWLEMRRGTQGPCRPVSETISQPTANVIGSDIRKKLSAGAPLPANGMPGKPRL